jgi:hypothetical protein
MQTPEPSDDNASAPEIPPEQECGYCRKKIPAKAIICHHCRYYQNSVRHNLVTAVQIASLAGFFLTMITLYLASQQRTKADEALETASTAQRKTETSASQMQKIELQMQSAEERLRKVQEGLKASEENITHVNEIAEFTITVTAAQNDDRKAFDKLKAWMQDSDFPRASEARQAVEKIIDGYRELDTARIQLWIRDMLEKRKVTLQDIEALLKQSFPVMDRRSFVSYAWFRDDFPKKKKAEFLINIIRNDNHLAVVAEAGRFFNSVSRQGVSPLAIEAHLRWWEKNKDTIPEN